MDALKDSIHRLLVEAATNLPADVRRALRSAMGREPDATPAALALHAIARNADLAAERCRTLCQDTGLPSFSIKVPIGADQLLMSQLIAEAVAEATTQGQLRPNSLQPFGQHATANNLGPGTPRVAFEQWLSDDIEVFLILKGGASENASLQYSLPCELPPFGSAERSLDGVRSCVLHAVHRAQGHGCGAGVVGVAVGGDRASGYLQAEAQLLRSLDDVNPEASLARLETEILDGSDALGVGTMGLGGRVTLLGCKVGTLNRLPSTFLVTVVYNCWALRRVGAVLDSKSGAIKRWIHGGSGAQRLALQTRLPLTGRERTLKTPLSDREVRDLRIGDVVLLNGTLHTGREALHHYLAEHDAAVRLKGAVLYHCSPVASRQGGEWVVTAAGPETSAVEEDYEADLIRAFGIRAVMGKGGMGRRTLEALRECGAVYLTAVGGAAQFYASCVESVEGVDFLAFGMPQAMWRLRVKDLPAVVTMDAHGGSLHTDVERASAEQLLRQAAS
jgi:fumarate hydratase, class I